MLLLLMLLFGLNQESNAKEDLTIVDVRRNITLADSDPIYKDFYINAGYASGLKKNLVVTAVRKINIRDANGATAVGDINVPVGKLRIIAVFDKVSVAREFEELSRDELPMLEQTGIMNGDNIDLKGSYVDNSKPKIKRNIAEESAPPEESKASTEVNVSMVATTATSPSPPPSSNPPVESAKNEAAESQKSSPPASPAEELLKAPPSKGEMLEKTADSGNNSGHE